MSLNESPGAVAQELILKFKGNHRAAEAEAWKLREGHGRESGYGRLLAAAAFEIADRYHNVPWQNEDYRHAGKVPVFERTQ